MELVQLPLDVNIDLFECGQEIIMNPCHEDKIHKLEKNYVNEKLKKQGIFIPRIPRIKFDNLVPAQSESKDRWEIGKNLDDSYITWIEKTDLINPPSWMIYFGLVKRPMVDVCFVVKKHHYWIKSNLNYDINSIINKQYIKLEPA